MRFAIAACFLALSTLAHAVGEGITLPVEPDYEEEKLRFQRGTEPYYDLPAGWLERGVGAPASLAVARAAEASARQGHAQAAYRVGVWHLTGALVSNDAREAHAWFARAAAKGHVKAMLQLGLASERGRGTPQDFAEATGWYERAARAGSVEACFLRGLMPMLGKGTPAIDYAEARRWLGQAAKKDFVPAWVNLGWLDEFGRGLAEPDAASALHWYRRAASRGDTLAQYNAGTLYGHGKGVEMNAAEARTWLMKAAHKNYAPAFYSLAVLANTPGPARDVPTAYQWFLLALAARYPGVKYDVEKLAVELTPAQVGEAQAWVAAWRQQHQLAPV